MTEIAIVFLSLVGLCGLLIFFATGRSDGPEGGMFLAVVFVSFLVMAFGFGGAWHLWRHLP